MRDVAGKVRAGIVGVICLGAVAMATAAGAAEGTSDNSTPPPWAGKERSLMFEAGAFGALAVGGHFHLQDAAVIASSTGSTVSLADRGAFAITADLQADEGSQYELFYSHEATSLGDSAAVPRTDVTVEYLHVGGTLLLDAQPAIKPYAVGGLGITRFTPGQEGNTDTKFSLSLGLGLRWPVTRHFSVRLEGRGFMTLVNPDTSVFCRSDQNGLLCRIHGSGRTFLQGEFLAGAAFAF
jgi:opacity protein-like surface antigen